MTSARTFHESTVDFYRWPPRCFKCGSENMTMEGDDYPKDVWRCGACGHGNDGHAVFWEREYRARQEVEAKAAAARR